MFRLPWYRTGFTIVTSTTRHLLRPSPCSLRSYSSPIHRPSTNGKPKLPRTMGKNKKSSTPGEQHLLLPQHPHRSAPDVWTPIVDTHTHLLSTFSLYRSKYKTGKYATIYDFVREVYRGHSVDAIVDVYCEAPEHETWKEVADSALTVEDRKDKWGGLEYWFVMGTRDYLPNSLVS